MAAGSRIAVEIVGNSADLQAALSKAAESLQALGTEVAKQTDLGIRAGDQTIAANAKLAESYGKVAKGAVESSQRAAAAQVKAGDEVSASLEKQSGQLSLFGAKLEEHAGQMQMFAFEEEKAYAKVAEAAGESARAQIAAGERAAAAGKEAAGAASQNADEQVGASRRTATAAGESADVTVRAADRSAAAQRGVAAAAKKSSTEIEKAGKLAALGLAAVAAGGLELAVKFQEATTRLHTQAGATVQQVAALRAGMLKMASDVGKSPDALAAGMYHVVSSMNAVLPASQRVRTELHVLRIAAEGAQVGGSDLEDTAYALASAMNATHAPIRDAGKIMGELNSIVGSGDMTMQQLLDALKGGLIPSARASGVSLQSLGASLAVMGDMGQQGALAGTRLRMAIALLAGPSKAAATILDTLGLSSKQATSDQSAMAKALYDAGLRTTSLSADLRKPDGIMVALEDLDRHLHQAGLTTEGVGAVLTKAFGGGRTGAGIAELAQNTGRLSTKFKQIGQDAGAFGHDWQQAQQTAAVQLRQLGDGLLALGTELGTDLLPYFVKAVHGVEDLVHWFEQGSTAAHEMELAIGVLASVAIGAYLIGKLQKAIALLRELRAFVNDPLHLSVTGGTAGAAPTAAGAGAVAQAEHGIGIGGARSGYGLPGSPPNPIVVAVESGEAASLGSLGAKGPAGAPVAGSGATAAEGGAGAAEGGAAGAASAAEGAALPAAEGATLATALKTGLNDVLSKVMKGGMIALGGSLVSNLVGELVGGKTGKAIGGIGSDAAIGAGIGTVFGPEGTFAGAVLGGLVGAFTTFVHSDASKYGTQMADKFTAPLGPAIKDRFAKPLADALNQAHQTTQQASQDKALTTPAGEAAHGFAYSAQEQAQIRAQAHDTGVVAAAGYAKAGLEAAQAFDDAFSQAKVKSAPQFVLSAEASLAKLPKASQDAAAAMMIQFAGELQQKGDLPTGAVNQIIQEMEAGFPGLKQYLSDTADQTAQTVVAHMNFQGALQNLTDLVPKMRTQFALITSDGVGQSHSLVSEVALEMGQLKADAQNTVGATRQTYQQGFQQLSASVVQTYTSMTQEVIAKQAAMTSSIQSGSASAAAAASQNFAMLNANILQAMSAGVLTTGKGSTLIAQNLNSALKAFGGKPVPVPTAVTMAGAAIGSAIGSVPGAAASAFHKADGGYIGNAGERGRDEVVTVLGRGEAVLNHKQQAVANRFLTPIGGLSGLFNRTKGSLHYMASGGFVVGASEFGGPGDPGTPGDSGKYGTDVTGSIARLQSGGSYFNVLAPGSHWTLTASSGKSVDATVTDLGAGGGAVDGHPRAIDLWWQTANALGLPGTSGAWTGLLNVTPSGVGGSAPAAGVGAATVPALRMPKVTGTGTVAAIVQAAVDKMTKAANANLAKQQPGGGYVFNTGKGIQVKPPKNASASLDEMIAEANAIASHDYYYEWGGGHGAFGVPSHGVGHGSGPGVGFDCSGAVSAVLHAGGELSGTPLVAADFMNYGIPGAGQSVSIFADATHVFMELAGRYFGTSTEFNFGGGANWMSGFPGDIGVIRHPPGMAAGGYADTAHGLHLDLATLDAQTAAKVRSGALTLLPGMAAGGIAENANTAKVLKTPKAAKAPAVKVPKPPKAPKIPKQHFAKPSALQLPLGFKSPAFNQFNALTQTKLPDLQGWYSYLDTLYGDPNGAQTVITVTNPDGTTTDTINWGSNAPGIPLTAFTGMPDPTTGQSTKGIYDWVRDIGQPPSADSNKHPPMTLLGVDMAIEQMMIQAMVDAAASQTQLSGWASGERNQIVVDDLAIAWLEHALDPAYPYAQLSPDALENILSGKVQIPGKRDGKRSVINESQAKYVEQIMVDYKNQLADLRYLEARRSKLGQQRSDREAVITRRFTEDRAHLAAMTATDTFDASGWLRTRTTDLTNDENAALAAVPTDPPPGWSGTKSAWIVQRDQERADIRAEYGAQVATLRNTAAENSFQGQLSRMHASTKLTLEEAGQRTSLTDYFDQLNRQLSNQITGDEHAASSDRSYLTSIKSTISSDASKATQALSSIVSSDNGTLAAYLDPQGTTAISLLELEQIQIPGLITDLNDFLGTTLSPAAVAAAGSGPDSSSLLAELYQQIALQASEEYALSQAQTAALASMIPEIPHYSDGGPILKTGLAMVHEGEHVVPRGGTLVSTGGGHPPQVHIHVHGSAEPFIETIRAEIRNPQNVRAVSQAIGQRTSMLAGRPGGGRGRF